MPRGGGEGRGTFGRPPHVFYARVGKGALGGPAEAPHVGGEARLGSRGAVMMDETAGRGPIEERDRPAEQVRSLGRLRGGADTLDRALQPCPHRLISVSAPAALAHTLHRRFRVRQLHSRFSSA